MLALLGLVCRDVPQYVKLLGSEVVLYITGGAFHVAALTDQGEVWVWGQNAEGQLGLGDFSQRNQPTRVAFLVGINIIKVATGAYHTLVLTDVGDLYTTGLNDNGQLGHGDVQSRKVPTLVTSLQEHNISSVAAGDYASYAITDAGEVYSWGNNGYQQLGLSIPRDMQSILLPTRIQALKDKNAVIYQIFGGQRTVFAVDQGSDIYAIGNNDFGMLGMGDETQRATPEKVNNFVGDNVFQIASGAYHSVAITGCFDLAMPCSGHGECDGNGQCMCDTGYKGYRCSDECPGGIGNACNNNGDCVTPLGGASFCICFQGYIGADCSFECPGGAVNTCSGNGICMDNGECQCDTGWSGFNCSTPCPGTRALPCSGLGQCTDGTCNCFMGFSGPNCSTECNGGAYNPCSYNGVCQSDGKCKCYQGFRRSDCSCGACSQPPPFSPSHAPCLPYSTTTSSRIPLVHLCRVPLSAQRICTRQMPPAFLLLRLKSTMTKLSAECPGGRDNVCYGRGTCNDDCGCECGNGYRGQNCSVGEKIVPDISF